MKIRLDERVAGVMAGVFLGLGAPVGSLFLSAFSQHLALTPEFISTESKSFFSYYLYLGISAPLVFAGFGLVLSSLNHRIREQNLSLEHAMAALKVQAVVDDVTSLYNHRHLMDAVKKEVERAHRHQHDLSGIMVDVDDFKQINDRYGHIAGDLVLREIGSVLQQSVRIVDFVGRYGGDEFVIILPETRVELARLVANRILANVRQHRFSSEKGPINLTISVGLFSFDSFQQYDSSQFIASIDEAMFKAKSSGKNRIFELGAA